MKPPDESPETVVWDVSTLNAGNATAAYAAPQANAAAAAQVRKNLLNVIECLLLDGWAKQPLPPVWPGGSLRTTDQKEGRPPLWKGWPPSAACCESARPSRW